MKKSVLTTIILFIAGSVMAGESFVPVNLADATSGQVVAPASAQAEETLGNTGIQNAILQIDNAQVEIRNQLLDLKTKFADVDAQYVSVKAERKALKKQLNQSEKRLKSLDKAKEKMRKTMI